MSAEFTEYQAVLAKVDAKFAEIVAQRPGQYACGAGCHSCCLPGLSVAQVEAAHIRAWLAENPEALERVRAVLAERPHGHTRCALLDASGQCTIYPVRPMLCRAHGVPVRLREGEREQVDVCPKNLVDVSLASLPPGECIDQNLLATLLFVVGRRRDPGDDGRRIPLSELV
ncbi:MAG: YkgJ family cysteine cluster protein [Deltaproteobacteria bacterium]|nr:YkgJ family cysteine cluster protein [Deltaproteobacteria bacterium]